MRQVVCCGERFGSEPRSLPGLPQEVPSEISEGKISKGKGAPREGSERGGMSFDEPIEGEILGMPMEAYALTCQLLRDDGFIETRELRQLASFVELDKDSHQFKLEMPRII